MKHRTSHAGWGVIPPALIGLLLAYLFTFGATWSGVFEQARIPSTLLTLAVGFAAWLAIRTVEGWRWPITALDISLPLWAVAVILAAAANPTSLPRTVFGVWFVGLYLIVWYALSDLIANGLSHVGLTDAFLLAGIPIMLTALGEIGTLDRVSGVLQNPNILGGFLVLSLPVAVGRLLARPKWAERGPWWAGWGLYIVMAGAALAYSGSRGAWIGVGAAVAFIGWALFFQHIHIGRAALIGIVIIGVAGIVLLLTRGDAGRMAIYEAGLTAFGKHPITGNGLFSFKFWEPVGNGLYRLHIQTHNLVLHVAAELGLIGLAAFALSVWRLGAAGWGHWKAASPTQKPIYKGALAALVGFAAHQMVDVPAMTPAVALALIIVLVIACTPVRPKVAQRGRHLRPLVALVVIAAVLVVGFAANAYTPKALSDAVNYGNP